MTNQLSCLRSHRFVRLQFSTFVFNGVALFRWNFDFCLGMAISEIVKQEKYWWKYCKCWMYVESFPSSLSLQFITSLFFSSFFFFFFFVCLFRYSSSPPSRWIVFLRMLPPSSCFAVIFHFQGSNCGVKAQVESWRLKSQPGLEVRFEFEARISALTPKV